ncbi:MAG TPA: alanine--tRNA ligase [Acidimicrobiales bacterium]|nr:alanine--tRNA ligase [Acidimicrobiales bacterium]
MRSSDDVRETFLGFFTQRDHTRIPGASVLAKDDPTLLFVNAGMAPLKEYFTGVRTPPTPNLANVQPCIRTIDIDDIGDRHHLSFFEMMGSWSIGEYWKERACALAYELLTDGFGIDPERLWVTVFEGDAAMGLPADEESAEAWEKAGVPRSRIVPQPTADNFWGPAGNSGPCGPCTEVFLDCGDAYGPAYVPGGHFDTEGRYIEIWNAAVCMEFDKGLDGTLSPLPFRSIDTGSGLERITMALNGYDNVYQTDLLAPLVAAVQGLLGEDGEVTRAHRVIADHLRASVAILAEGVRPSNEGAGYIPRRLLRRAATLALTRGVQKVDFTPVVEAAVARLAPFYPHYAPSGAAVVDAVRTELGEFEGALRRGLGRLDEVLAASGSLSGAQAYDLLSTYGLPEEIARDLAVVRGATIDDATYRAEFEASRATHQERSRGSAQLQSRITPQSVLPAAVASLPATVFVGYDAMEADATVLAVLGGSGAGAGVGEEVDVIVDRTPCYGEGGGQVGDHGSLTWPGGEASVEDTIVHPSGKHVHRVEVTAGTLEVGQAVTVRTDVDRRIGAAANHSATHLLNAALRRVLGDHVHQAGSLVGPDRMRFDFTHPKPVSAEELEEIERLVNGWVLDDLERRVAVMTPEEAIAAGATSLEGEKYPDDVRVVSFGGDPAAGFGSTVSTELCGGTHVTHTGQLGLFRIAGQESVASGVRRVTCLTRGPALEFTLQQAKNLAAVATVVQSSPRDVVEAVERLVTRSKQAPRQQAASGPADVTQTTVGGVDVLVGSVPADGAGQLRGTAGGLAKTADRMVVLFTDGDPSTLAVAVPERYAGDVDARAVLSGLLGPLGGRGGGSPVLAQGGGARRPDAELLVQSLGVVLAA